MHMKPLIYLLVLISSVHSARILCYFAFPSVSHQNVFRAIWKALALRKHEVVVVTPNPLNDPTIENLREIDVSSSYEVVKKTPLLKAFSADNPYLQKQNSIFELTTLVLEHQFNLPQIQELFNDENKKFDLIMIHTFFMPALYGLSHKYKCPIIGVISFGMPLQGHDSVGNPSHPGLYPDLLLNFGNKLDFTQRWWSTFYSVIYRINYHFNIMPKADAFARKYFGNDLPYLLDLEKNVSMQFMNVNPILYPPRPNVPAVLELRQMHITPPKPLPEDLQRYLDDAKEGVIYFSLGSNVKSDKMDNNLREIIVSALAELPYKVLWKWESDHLPNKPSNVLTRKWLPQQDVLAHPNIKAFITQGGLQSTEEAIANGVPLVGIPFLADQPMNIIKLAEAGVCVPIDKSTVTKDQLKNAIIDAAENIKYRDKMKEIQILLDDQPMKSLDEAVWWTEFVIRHKGARHLRSPAVDMPLYQYLLFDVIAVTVFIPCIFIYILYKSICYLFYMSCGLKKKLKTK